MFISPGFYKKICDWIYDETSEEIVFRPFQLNGNPYKSKVFVVGVSPEPLEGWLMDDIELYAEALVDADYMEEVNDFYEGCSREFKGTLNFVDWMKRQYNEDVIMTSLNCYCVQDISELKALRKKKVPLVEKGDKLFTQVLTEFQPEIIVLHGTKPWKEFLERFKERIVPRVDTDTLLTDSVQSLEQKGVIAEMQLHGGKLVKIVVCRSLSHFGKEGTSFKHLKATIDKLL